MRDRSSEAALPVSREIKEIRADAHTLAGVRGDGDRGGDLLSSAARLTGEVRELGGRSFQVREGGDVVLHVSGINQVGQALTQVNISLGSAVQNSAGRISIL